MSKTFQNFIGGRWVDAKSGKTFENRNPANWDEIVGIFPRSGKEDVDEAVRAARTAFETWRLVPAPKRGDIMRRVGDLMVSKKEELARQMTRLAFLHHALPACVAALVIRARQEPGFDPAGYLAERRGHSGFGEQVARASLDSVNRLLYAAACYFGLELVQQTAAELAEDGVVGAEAVGRLGWGGWAYPCYRGAVLGVEQLAG